MDPWQNGSQSRNLGTVFSNSAMASWRGFGREGHVALIGGALQDCVEFRAARTYDIERGREQVVGDFDPGRREIRAAAAPVISSDKVVQIGESRRGVGRECHGIVNLHEVHASRIAAPFNRSGPGFPQFSDLALVLTTPLWLT